MSEIFRKPNDVFNDASPYGVNTLFLHGLEGSVTGKKATFLKEEWGTLCPPLRTVGLVAFREANAGIWPEKKTGDLANALKTPYDDALDAIRYAKPDIVIGSSMGAAILFKAIAEGHYSGIGVFLAPAITNLLDEATIRQCLSEKSDVLKKSVWVLGETDTVVSNDDNFFIARTVGASLLFSPNDCHRLNKAVDSNILNSAILTAVEMHDRK